MNNDYQQKLSDYENEFIKEEKGYGSLSPYCVVDAANFSKDLADDEGFYVGYDIHPENIEALYFEGLKLPRWESIKAENDEQHKAIYLESFQRTMSDYPLIGRISDTDESVVYAPEEVIQLQAECKQVLESTNDTNALKALLKFYIACNKAVEKQTGLLFIPT